MSPALEFLELEMVENWRKITENCCRVLRRMALEAHEGDILGLMDHQHHLTR